VMHETNRNTRETRRKLLAATTAPIKCRLILSVACNRIRGAEKPFPFPIGVDPRVGPALDTPMNEPLIVHVNALRKNRVLTDVSADNDQEFQSHGGGRPQNKCRTTDWHRTELATDALVTASIPVMQMTITLNQKRMQVHAARPMPIDELCHSTAREARVCAPCPVDPTKIRRPWAPTEQPIKTEYIYVLLF